MDNKKVLTELDKASITIIALLLITLIANIFINQSKVLISDEQVFYPALEKYTSGEMTLKNSILPQPGLYLIVFGGFFTAFKGDILALRAVNLFFFLILVVLLIYSAKYKSDLLKVLLLIIITPYMLFMSMSIYSDMLFMLLLLGSFILYRKEYYFYSFIGFSLAIATRQFGVIFPLAIALIAFNQENKKRWIYPLLSCLTLLLIYIYFGFNLSPSGATSEPIKFNLFSGIVFLAGVGAFYTIPKILLFSKAEDIKILNIIKLRLFLFLAAIFIIVMLFLAGSQHSLLLSHWYWFYYIFALGPISVLFISILAAFAFIYTSDSFFDKVVLILSFLMFSSIVYSFDKYIVPYVVIFSYMFLSDYKLIESKELS